MWDTVSVGSAGERPSARGGHAVAVLGSELFMFGGADRSPQAFDDLWRLPLRAYLCDLKGFGACNVMWLVSHIFRYWRLCIVFTTPKLM